MVAELVAIVSGSRENRKDIWIVIDGIDTCEQGGLTRCIALMDMISAGGKNSGDIPCKVLLTSRSEPPKKVIRKRSVVSLGKEAANVNEAIRLYTIRRLHSSPTADRLGQLGFSLKAVTELADEITLKADGMFLYARLIIDYLSKQLFRTKADLRDALRELPPELKGLSVNRSDAPYCFAQNLDV
ncbi:hypothetical protein G3M48_005073 [Beauveria asiatica]|uniref:NACHT domain-containing protein n=1 Tax=Beauveria asiatica TaxID=1069075 RepID=A0AAW0RSY6_9HYPO